MWFAGGYRVAIPFLVLAAAAAGVACAPDRERAPARGFYAEIAVSADTHPGDPLTRFGRGGSRSVIRWWYAPDPDRWRWEVETAGAVIDDGVLLTVVDADDSWEYDDRTHTYRRVWGRYASLGAEAMVLPSFGVLVGPVRADSTDALMARWRERGDDPEVARAGEATVLGRRTQIVEIRAPAGNVARAFVDPERMFVMRWDFDGGDGGQSYRAEIAALDYGTEIDPARFTFEPPPGAREARLQQAASCSRASGPIGGASFPAEPGFLAPAYTPPGYRSAGAGAESGANTCEPIAVWVTLEADDGGAILLRQRYRPGGMPTLDRSWQRVASRLDEAHRHSEDGVVSVLWRAGDIVALLRADAVTLEELLRIAESAGLVPRGTR